MTKNTKLQPITVEVTASDIKRGKSGDAYGCAIARALKRSRFKEVSVGPGYVEMTRGTGKKLVRFACDLPKRALRFIEKFDSDNVDKSKLKPFSFTLRTGTATPVFV